MKLCTHVRRIESEFAELGYAAADAIGIDELSNFDQLHYHGTDALDVAPRLPGARAGQRWHEVGSGTGGPARYLAHRGAVTMIAFELQPHQDELAAPRRDPYAVTLPGFDRYQRTSSMPASKSNAAAT